MANPTPEENIAQTALEAGRRLEALAQNVNSLKGNNVPFALIPDGTRHVDLSAFLDRPLRTKATPSFTALASFLAYVDRFKTDDTLIYGSLAGNTLLAIIDHHAPEAPDHNGHRATLALKPSEEWHAWLQRCSQAFSQASLAEWFEERSCDIASPDAATLLEAVNDLKLKKDVTYTRSQNLANGASALHYAEDVTHTGQIVLPETLTVQLRAYEGGELVALKCFLRYKLADGKVTFALKLDRPDRVKEAAFNATCAAVGTHTGLDVLLGTP